MLQIEISGIAAEIVLGKYMPKDATIFNNWEEFYHFNDVLHQSQLLAEYRLDISVTHLGNIIFQGRIQDKQVVSQKSFSPALLPLSLYLRTECAEKAIYECSIDTDNFDFSKLSIETQDYGLLFSVGKSFVASAFYDGKRLELEWKSAVPAGNICVLCRAENGCLIPVYDAIKKIAANK